MVKILLLEDDMSLAVGLRFALEKEGWAVDTARTLAEGSALWAAGGYTLLVLDVSLPDGTGFDFCRRVRASSPRRRHGRRRAAIRFISRSRPTR